jgi:hypothetical protein
VNRTYNAGLGRFTQVDPIAMGAVYLGNPQSLNLYAYCFNDPINHTDPDGLDGGVTFVVIQVVSAVIGLFRAIFGGGKRARTAPIIKQITHRRQGQITNRTVWSNAMISASIGAVSNFTQQRSSRNRETAREQLIRRLFFLIYGQAYNDCIRGIFGRDARRVPRQTFSNSPTINARLNSTQVGQVSGVSQAVGSSRPFSGRFGTVLIDSGTFNGSTPNTMRAIWGTYAHEAGNILDIRLNPNAPQSRYGRNYGDRVNPPGGDTDTGANIERCVFGSLQYP